MDIRSHHRDLSSLRQKQVPEIVVSLSLTPKGATVLSAQKGPPASSEHPHLAQGKARPCQQCSAPLAPVRSIQGTVKQTPQRKRGMEAHGLGRKQASPEEEVLGLNFIHDGPASQTHQLPSFLQLPASTSGTSCGLTWKHLNLPHSCNLVSFSFKIISGKC